MKNSILQLIKSMITNLRIMISTISAYIKRGMYLIYHHTIIIIFWAIGLFFLVIGIGLILPIPFSFTRYIFGNVVEDDLISFIMGTALFSTAILSIQQTYARREKLLIGEI